MIVALIFAVLLGLEWRYRLRTARMVAAVLALVVSFFYQPAATRAVRRALTMPPAERVTEIPGGPPLSEYEIGVYTMQRAVADDSKMGYDERLLSMGVLFWLACSPVIPRARRSSAPAEPALDEAAV